MKNFFFLVSILLGICGVCQAQKASTSSQKNGDEKVINSEWTFNYFPSESAEKGYETLSFDDSRWSAVSFPHTWNTFETTGEIKVEDNAYWRKGWGWYRKHFRIN
ncbi:MAG TPA: hypothetical protein VHO50_11545, partial [Bacteroidales bacterium]|nr:hypothetical protein [Bacteroidales bacterium]